MPQGPFQNVILSSALHSSLNISAATLVKPTNGFAVKVSVTVAGSAAGAIYDSASIAGAGTANLIAVIPDVAGTYSIEFPFANGLVVSPGTGQTVSISYN